MSTAQLTLPTDLETAEGIEAVLQVLLLAVKEKLPTYIAAVEAEWDTIDHLELDDPDSNSYAIINDEEALPEEVSAFPFVVVMGFQDRPEDEAIEQKDIDFYVYSVKVRVWVKGDIASEVTKRTFRYADAVKRVLKYYAEGAYDSNGTQTVCWTIRNISGLYSALSPGSPYFMCGDIDAQIGVFREW